MILTTGASGQLAWLVAQRAKAIGLQFETASRSPEADRRMDIDEPSTQLRRHLHLFLVSAEYAEDDVVMRRNGLF